VQVPSAGPKPKQSKPNWNQHFGSAVASSSDPQRHRHRAPHCASVWQPIRSQAFFPLPILSSLRTWTSRVYLRPYVHATHLSLAPSHCPRPSTLIVYLVQHKSSNTKESRNNEGLRTGRTNQTFNITYDQIGSVIGAVKNRNSKWYDKITLESWVKYLKVKLICIYQVREIIACIAYGTAFEW